MAKSRYDYVKQFELDDRLLPGCWFAVRLDGRQFRTYVRWLSRTGSLVCMDLVGCNPFANHTATH